MVTDKIVEPGFPKQIKTLVHIISQTDTYPCKFVCFPGIELLLLYKYSELQGKETETVVVSFVKT